MAISGSYNFRQRLKRRLKSYLFLLSTFNYSVFHNILKTTQLAFFLQIMARMFSVYTENSLQIPPFPKEGPAEDFCSAIAGGDLQVPNPL